MGKAERQGGSGRGFSSCVPFIRQCRQGTVVASECDYKNGVLVFSA
jgi:hypothetical protein